MRYRRITAAAVAVPRQEPGKPFRTSQVLPFGSVVGLMTKNIPSPVTGKKNEWTVKWKNMAGKTELGWIAVDTQMDNHMSKKELSRGLGELRVSAWDVIRKRVAAAPGWTAKKWVCAFAETNLPLLHAVIRELGGKVPKTDDEFTAISRVVKLITGEDITMKEAEAVKDSVKKANIKKSKTKKNKRTTTGKVSSKTKTKKRSGKKASRAGRASAFKGLRIFRLVKSNPRREGSTGWNSWNVIKKGMLYEDFIKAGGNPGSLRNEVKFGRVKMKK